MESQIIETQIVFTAPDQTLAPSILSNLQEGFQSFFVKAEEWRAKAIAIRVTSADQKGEMKLAYTCRQELKKIRVEAEKTRKRLKEDSLRMGKAIDGINNLLLAAIVPLETYLEEQEKFGERLEAERIAKLTQEREEVLRPFIGEGQPPSAIGLMSGEAWDGYLADARLLHEAKIERAKKEEEERVAKEKAEAAARLRIQEENERLKKEAAEREEAMRLEREAAEKSRIAAELAARKEREALEAAAAEERRVAAEKARIEREAAEKEAAQERARLQKVADEERAKAQAAADAQAKLERENAERLAAEEKERKAKAAADKKAAQAPDKEKLLAFAQSIRFIKVPACSSPEAAKVAEEVQSKVESFAKWIEAQSAVL